MTRILPAPRVRRARDAEVVARAAMLAAALCLWSAPPALAQPDPVTRPPRTREAWIALREAAFVLPPGEKAFAVLKQMNALLASPDPVLRDAVAYEAAARWIYTEGALSADEQRDMLALWTRNLKEGLGDSGTDRTFRRSFSALSLSILAARDHSVPFLTQDEFDRFLADVLDYLAGERDTRGYDREKGWVHAAAHAADVLKFLARNTKLTAAGQARVLAAIDAKCAAAGGVFQWGEDERLAQVVASLARRPDVDRPAFDRWLAALVSRRNALWSAPPAIDPARFPEIQNLKLVLRAAYVALSLDRDPAAGREGAAALLATLGTLR